MSSEAVDSIPQIISAASQSLLGILALLVIALSVLANFFFAKASVKVKVSIFVLLFAGVVGFGVAMFRVPPAAAEASSEQRWYVVVASVTTVEDAAEKVKVAKDKGFPNAAYVLQPQSNFIAVVIGENLRQEDAQSLKAKAKETGLSSEPYLWPFKND